MSIIDPRAALLGQVQPFPPMVVQNAEGQKLAIPMVGIAAIPDEITIRLVQAITNNVVGTLLQPCSFAAAPDCPPCGETRMAHAILKTTTHVFTEPVIGEQATDA